MSIGYRVKERFGKSNGPYAEIEVFTTRVPSDEAKFAMALIERWGMVAALPDGEDSSGRQKLKLMEPSVLVERACVVTSMAFNALRHNGWLLDLPTPMQAEETLREKAAEDTEH